MTKLSIPKFNTIQKVLIRALYSRKNSITIFTEDKPSDLLFYKILFNRLNIEGIKINEIIPLGAKSVVIEKSIETENSDIPSLFIVDGDIKLLLGQKLETKNLIALDKYCMENFLCCQEGVLDYLHLKLGGDKEQLKTTIDFENFIIKNASYILELYYRYAIAFELQCGVGFKNVEEFYNSPGRVNKIDVNKVKEEIRNVETIIKNKLKNNGVKKYRQECDAKISHIRDTYPVTLENILSLPSGKDLILPLIVRLIINKLDSTSGQLSKDQIKRILAEKINIRHLDKIKNKVFEVTGHI